MAAASVTWGVGHLPDHAAAGNAVVVKMLDDRLCGTTSDVMGADQFVDRAPAAGELQDPTAPFADVIIHA